MKFTVRREPLLEVLHRLQSSVEKKSTVAVLGSFLCEVKSSELSVFGTDLEIGMKARLAVTGAEPGRVAISARSFLEIVRELPPHSELAFMRKENGWIDLQSAPYRFDLLGMAPQGYAPISALPAFDEKTYLPVRAQALAEMIDKTAFALSADTALYHLNGAYLEFLESGRARMTATDTYRLSYCENGLFLAGSAPKHGLIIPKKGLLELRKLLEGAETVDLAFERGQLYARSGNTWLFVRLIEGEYIDYQRIVPAELGHTVVLDRERFAADLRRVSLLASEKTRSIRLALSHNRMEISCSNSELGQARVAFEVAYAGEELEVGFNARYLLEYLHAARAEQVELCFRNRLSAALLRERDARHQAYVIMPMRL